MWLSKIISLIVYIGTLLLISLLRDETTHTVLVIISGVGLIGLICVWFGDAMNWMSDFVYKESSPTPGCMFRVLGWILLFIPYVAIIILKLT